MSNEYHDDYGCYGLPEESPLKQKFKQFSAEFRAFRQRIRDKMTVTKEIPNELTEEQVASWGIPYEVVTNENIDNHSKWPKKTITTDYNLFLTSPEGIEFVLSNIRKDFKNVVDSDTFEITKHENVWGGLLRNSNGWGATVYSLDSLEQLISDAQSRVENHRETVLSEEDKANMKKSSHQLAKELRQARSEITQKDARIAELEALVDSLCPQTQLNKTQMAFEATQ